MNAKEIKLGMSPTPWKAGSLMEPNIDNIAAKTAVNNTYGKGLDPEVYEDVVNKLQQISDGYIVSESIVKELLKKARI